MTLNDSQASLGSCEMQMNEKSNGTIEKALKVQANVKNEGSMQRMTYHNQMGQNFKRRNLQSDSSQGTKGYRYINPTSMNLNANPIFWAISMVIIAKNVMLKRQILERTMLKLQ